MCSCSLSTAREPARVERFFKCDSSRKKFSMRGTNENILVRRSSSSGVVRYVAV